MTACFSPIIARASIVTAYASSRIVRASRLFVVVAISHFFAYVRFLVGRAPLPSASSYLGCKGNQFKNKRVLMEAIHKKKGETARIKALKEQVGTNHGASVDTSPCHSFFWCHVSRCSLVKLCFICFRDLSVLRGYTNAQNAFLEYIHLWKGFLDPTSCPVWAFNDFDATSVQRPSDLFEFCAKRVLFLRRTVASNGS